MTNKPEVNNHYSKRLKTPWRKWNSVSLWALFCSQCALLSSLLQDYFSLRKLSTTDPDQRTFTYTVHSERVHNSSKPSHADGSIQEGSGLFSYSIQRFQGFLFRPYPPLHSNISIHILHTVLLTFPRVLTRRICLTIKSFFSWWSVPLFS